MAELEPQSASEKNRRTLPEAVVRYTASRSQGPGGQNVNKLNTRMTLTVAMSDLQEHLGQAVAGRLKRLAGRYIHGDGHLSITSDVHRSQRANKRECLRRLDALIGRARVRPMRRRRKPVPAAAKRRRLENKRHRSRIKARRREKFD
ncbi:MAG: peptide chain release factor-like protein [Phycisphaeraceae bacterium]|nr:peptide chain release factor-like protein [Phycisphaeraceae bacterium]